jgi:hypothetical protein
MNNVIRTWLLAHGITRTKLRKECTTHGSLSTLAVSLQKTHPDVPFSPRQLSNALTHLRNAPAFHRRPQPVHSTDGSPLTIKATLAMLLQAAADLEVLTRDLETKAKKYDNLRASLLEKS